MHTAHSTVCYIGGVHKEEVVNNSARAFNVFEMYFVFAIVHAEEDEEEVVTNSGAVLWTF